MKFLFNHLGTASATCQALGNNQKKIFRIVESSVEYESVPKNLMESASPFLRELCWAARSPSNWTASLRSSQLGQASLDQPCSGTGGTKSGKAEGRNEIHIMSSCHLFKLASRVPCLLQFCTGPQLKDIQSFDLNKSDHRHAG